MLQIRRILFPTDFSDCAESALGFAVETAARHGAALHVVHVDPSHAYDPARGMGGRGEVAAWAADRIPPGLAKKVRLTATGLRAVSPTIGILEYANEHHVDLVVMSTHGRRGFHRLLLGSVSEEVMHLAGCPVMLIRPTYELPKGECPAPRRIVVPVDFSSSSAPTVAHAGALAAAYGASVDLLHVVEEGTGGPPGKEAMGTLERSHEALLRLAGSLPEALDVEDHVLVGSPPSTIAAFARERGSDLIVQATHGRTGMKRVFLGSVAEKVIRAAPCPVFMVKSFGRSLLQPPSEVRAPAVDS